MSQNDTAENLGTYLEKQAYLLKKAALTRTASSRASAMLTTHTM